MNGYDFDKTIYNGDCTKDFYFYCLKKHPKVFFKVPNAISGAISHYILKKKTKTQFKEKMYTFLLCVNSSKDILEFWDRHEHKIKSWYINQKKDDDIIISASPHFLIDEICKRLDIKNVIASKVDVKTGKYTGLNCYGDEKVVRFNKEFSGSIIENFYSDSYSDTPLANISNKAFLVTGDNIKNW